MKKNALLVGTLILLTTTLNAAPDTKVKVVEVKPVEVKVVTTEVKPVTTDVKVVNEVKLQENNGDDKKVTEISEKDGLVSNISGIVVFKADVIKSHSEPKSETFLGDIDLNSEDETILGEKMPKGYLELGAKIFKNYDFRLRLNSTKSVAEETSYLAFSRQWKEFYAEWKSNVDLDANSFYKAVVPNSEFKVRKSKGRVEGQLKATVAKGVVDELTGESHNNYGVDIKSYETYIKVKIDQNSSLTLRPYDMEWKIGKRFENENMDRMYTLASVNNSWQVTGLSDLFDNVVSTGRDQRTERAGLEYERFNDKMRFLGKVGMFNASDYFLTQLAVDYKVNDNFKYTVASILGTGVNNLNPDDKSDIDENVNVNYFALNARGEYQQDKKSYEVEMDIKSDTYKDKSVSDNYSENNFMLGLYGRVNFGQVSQVKPYAYARYQRKSVEINDTNLTFTKPYNSFDIACGADKVIDDLTVTGEVLLNTSKEEQYELTMGSLTTKAEEKDYGTRFVASLKAVYRF